MARSRTLFLFLPLFFPVPSLPSAPVCLPSHFSFLCTFTLVTHASLPDPGDANCISVTAESNKLRRISNSIKWG